MKRDKLLEQAITEAEAFLRECKAYQKRINESYVTTYGGKPEKRYDDGALNVARLKTVLCCLFANCRRGESAGMWSNFFACIFPPIGLK